MSRFVYNPTVERQIALSPEVGGVLHERAVEGAAIARSLAPVDEGDYRDGIEAVSGVEGDSQVGRVNANDWKSHLIEFGTIHAPTFAILAKSLDAIGRG